MIPRIRIFRKLSVFMWSSPFFGMPGTNRPMIVLPIPPRRPNRLVAPTSTAEIESSS
jgi:hypothetical protein